MWSRPHLKDAVATEDEVSRPDQWQLVSVEWQSLTIQGAQWIEWHLVVQTDDKFWVVVFATAPAEVLLATSDEAPAQRRSIERGLSKLSHPMVAGASMKATMVRNGVVVAECAPKWDEFRVDRCPTTYNFNVYVGASL